MPKLAQLEALHARLLALFEGPLAGVRFPDVDADILLAHVRAASEAEARVERLGAELEEARGLLDQEEQKLEGRIVRGLAYLRVYVDGNPVFLTEPGLLTELEALGERLHPARPPAALAGAARRRGRSSKPSERLLLDTSAQGERPGAITPLLEIVRGETATQ